MPVMGPPASPGGKRTVSQGAVNEPANGDAPSKRVRFDEDAAAPAVDSDEEAEQEEKIDGDEEEDEDEAEYKVLADEDVEGQEDGTVKVDDGVRITPFNIQEELEEGHFDTDGNFYVDKDKEVKDAWLDGLDQFADQDFEKLRKQKAAEAAAEDAAAPAPLTDSQLYKVILSVVKPGESVGKALRRLGSGIKPTQRVKKSEKSAVFPEIPSTVDPIKKDFDALTSAADTILQKGNLEIYQETYEKIQHRLSKADSRLANLKIDDEADIFGDDFDATKVADAQSKTGSESHEDDDSSSQTMWEYKWLNADAAPIHGPYSSEQMVDWVQQDFFKDGVFVRKAGVIDAPFYSSKRVDFELYV